MSRTINRYGIYEVDHSTFGGIIYPSDYNTDNLGKNNYSGSPIANRIVSDSQLEKQWRKNRESIERNKQYGK